MRGAHNCKGLVKLLLFELFCSTHIDKKHLAPMVNYGILWLKISVYNVVEV